MSMLQWEIMTADGVNGGTKTYMFQANLHVQ